MIPAAGWTSTVEVRDGVAVLVRRAAEPEYQARLVRAAEVLAATDHPGVERIVAIVTDAEGTTLTTQLAGGRSLAGSPPTEARSLASLTAALAQLLDDLHRSGTVHGPLGLHHVVLADGDRPVLCGFSSGRLRSELDDEVWSACMADDVRMIGTLLNPLLDGLPPPHGLAFWERRTRLSLRRAARRTASGQADSAATVAKWCAAAAGPRPLSRLGRGRRHAHHTRTTPSPAMTVRTAHPERPGPRWQPSRLSYVGLLFGAICCVIGFAGLVGSSSTDSKARADETAAIPTARSSAPTNRRCPPPTGPLRGTLVDIDGDGCPERVLVDGQTLVVSGTRYCVGQLGDLMEVGDWDGDGIATPALVRPTTGAVFAFSSWPSPDRPLVAHPIARIYGVTDVQIHHGGDGHDSLLLDRSSGPPVPLDLDRPASRGSTP